MAAEQKDMKIPSELIPHCPVCGKPMTTNLRCDDKFVQDAGWHEACERYVNFLTEHENSKVLFLELGVGMNTPAIIKYPFLKMTASNKNAFYVCVNSEIAYAPDAIKDRALCISADIAEVIQNMR